MTDTIGPFEIMALPFAECLVLVGIHSYLGLHVLRRKVIFVDLALAQVAALGTTVAFLFGIDPLSKGAYTFSLFFTILGAAVFSLTRLRKDRIPQEAIIGLVYALAAAVGILVVGRAPHGAEHITRILTGVLFYVKGREILAAAVVYALVGLFHYIFRKRFIAISNDPEGAFNKGINVRLWDFLFYVSFGVVITHSVRTAGVLLVFVFLVVPAILAMLLTNRLFLQLLVGWALGTAVSAAGLGLSYVADSATGPTIITLYGLVLLIASLVIFVFRERKERLRRFLLVASGLVVVALLGAGLYRTGRWFGDSPYWGQVAVGSRHINVGETKAADTGIGRIKTNLTGNPGSYPDGWAVVDGEENDLLEELLPLDFESRKERISRVADSFLLKSLLEIRSDNDEELRVIAAGRLLELDGADEACPMLVQIMINGGNGFIRDEALRLLTLRAGGNFGFDPWDAPGGAGNIEPVRRWRSWVEDGCPLVPPAEKTGAVSLSARTDGNSRPGIATLQKC